MTAPKRDNRRFQTGRGMFRLGATYTCHCCKRQTRETGQDESSLGLCAYCLLESYLENELSDGVIEQPEFEQKLDDLQKQYKRGKYAKTEADAKTRKIQSSRYIAPVATESKPEVEAKVSVKLGYGIVQVLQLDDAGNVKDYNLTIDFSKKSFITVTGTRSALAYFADCCQNRISSQYDQPLWYMSAAKASMIKINAALKEAK